MNPESLRRADAHGPLPPSSTADDGPSIEEDCRIVVERLDKEWEVERRKYLFKPVYGPPLPVTLFGLSLCLPVLLAGCIFLAGCVLCLWSIPAARIPMLWSLLGIVVAVAGASGMVYFIRMSDQLEAAEKAYQRRRALALERLQHAADRRGIHPRGEPPDRFTPGGR